LIDAIKEQNTVGKFVIDLLKNDVGIYTVPVVAYEFLRGADTQDALLKRQEAFKAITGNFIFPIDKQFNGMTDFLLIMNRNVKCDLGEYQLIASIVNFPNRYILTENDKHMPKEFIDKVSIVTFNLRNEIKNYSFYKFNSENYEKIAEKLLS
jgi:hypothetical protein